MSSPQATLQCLTPQQKQAALDSGAEVYTTAPHEPAATADVQKMVSALVQRCQELEREEMRPECVGTPGADEQMRQRILTESDSLGGAPFREFVEHHPRLFALCCTRAFYSQPDPGQLLEQMLRVRDDALAGRLTPQDAMRRAQALAAAAPRRGAASDATPSSF